MKPFDLIPELFFFGRCENADHLIISFRTTTLFIFVLIFARCRFCAIALRHIQGSLQMIIHSDFVWLYEALPRILSFQLASLFELLV